MLNGELKDNKRQVNLLGLGGTDGYSMICGFAQYGDVTASS